MIVEMRVKSFKKSLEESLGSIKLSKDIMKLMDVDKKIVIDSIDSFEEACRLHVEEMKKELLNDTEKDRPELG